MKTLTRSEEQIMQVLWKIEKGFIRDIIEALPEPRPHQNTVATIVKILVEKEFVGITLFGRMHQYKPLVSKETYSKGALKNVVKGYFDGSVANVVSFFVKDNSISLEELEGLLVQIRKQKNLKK
jgi:BlaI family transcriptional regulator, penicillinase repressor